MNLNDALEQAYTKYKDVEEGTPATYMTALYYADPTLFGIAAMTTDGELITYGDTKTRFSQQSISKVFLMLLAFKEFGEVEVYKRVGVQPYGEMYNSIDLMPDGRAFNPMVNAGAITVAGMLYSKFGSNAKDCLVDFLYELSSENLMVDPIILKDEGKINNRNMAICYLLRQHDAIPAEVNEVIAIYNAGCSLEVTTETLATMGAVLANRGVHPKTGKQIIDTVHVQHCLSIMLMCGMYSGAGEWAVQTGVPAKSGVAGGLLAAIPERFGLGVYSPPLDEHGNSVRAIGVCQTLDDLLDIHAIMPLTGD
jgi:glutaminase